MALLPDWPRRPALLMACVLGCAIRLTAQESATGQEAAVLVTRFADGRTTHTVVTKSPRTSWTPLFPTLPGWRPSANELAITALKFTKTLGDGGTVRVKVAVLRGVAREREDWVATVDVIFGEGVTVDALRAVGVAPVTFSLTALADTTLHQPRVVNKTAGLEVTDIELVMTPRPRYRISVTNVSSQPAVNFHVVTYRDSRRGLSGNRGNPDASPIIAPGGTYAFDMDPSSGAVANDAGCAPLPHDLIEIAAVLWEDGTIEGEVAPMATALNVYLGRHAQLTRGIALLHAVRGLGQPLTAKAQLKAQLERLSIEPDAATQLKARERLRHVGEIDVAARMGALRVAMSDTRKGMLDDLAEAPADAVAFEQWLVEITALYDRWRERFATR
jgi:hypothetical protein